MEIGAAWLKESNGKKYFSCQISLPIIGELNFAIFKNEKKEKDNHPDYKIVWSKPKNKSQSRSETENPPPLGDNDIPF